jgi:ribonuclease R
MRGLTRVLQRKRKTRGAVDLTIPECKIILDEKTLKVANITAEPRKFSECIIEEFMLAANEAVAEWMCKQSMPFVYRVHEKPTAEKTESLAAFVETFGLRLRYDGEVMSSRDIQNLINDAAEQPFSAVISRVTLRSMQKANYSPECAGHFGLAAKFYCHFTSPIRRYPDLAIHRIIKDFLRNGNANANKFKSFCESASTVSSLRERAADEAEREADDMKKAEYMLTRIGEVFDGVISGVTAFGLFVELPDTCEGLIRIENLPGGRYDHNEKLHRLTGKKYSFRLGDSVKIRVMSADKELRRVEFALELEEQKKS